MSAKTNRPLVKAALEIVHAKEKPPLSIEQKIALARAPITRGILATNYHSSIPSMPHAGCGERPSTPVFNEWGRIVGSRALRTTDTNGE